MRRGGGAAGKRQRRVGESVRTELSRLLVRNVRDQELSWSTITTVEMSADLKHAKVYFVTSGGGSPERTRRSLEQAAPFLQRELGRTLKLRFTPKLDFRYDDSFDQGSRIDELIARAKTEDAVRRGGDAVEQRLAHRINDSEAILVATHANPDGDAVGSLIGLGAMLRQMGKRPVVFCPDGIPATLAFLPGTDEVVGEIDPGLEFELSVVVDTADENLLPDGFPAPERRGTLVVIDHHPRHGEFGDLVIRRDTAAVGELLYDLSRELVWPIDADVAQCLYTSIVADTGSFRYDSTTPHTHRVAAELVELGAEPWRVATALYESYPLARQRLLAEVLATLEIGCDGRYAALVATPEMLDRAAATKADLDGMVNFGRAVIGVEISAMFRREPGGEIKVSFRSKGRVDVGALASSMGGGGHANAAGCTLTDMGLEAAKAVVRAGAAELLERSERRDETIER